MNVVQNSDGHVVIDTVVLHELEDLFTMVDSKGSHGDVDVVFRDIDLLAVDDCLFDLSVVLHEVLAGVNDVYLSVVTIVLHVGLTGVNYVDLSGVNSLLKSLPGINESHLAIVAVEVLGNRLVMHVLNRRLCCSSARHT